MKKTILFFGALFCLKNLTIAQPYWNNTGTSGATVETTTTGNADVGGNLYIRGGMLDMPMTMDTWRVLNPNSMGFGMRMFGGNLNGAYIDINADGAADPGAININSSTAGGTGTGISFWNKTGGGIYMPLMNISNAGDVKITGNTQVGGTLAVQSDVIDMAEVGGDHSRTIVANSSKAGFNFLAGHNGTDGSWLGLHSVGDPGQEGCMNLHTIRQGSFTFFNHNGSFFNQLMKIVPNGDMILTGRAFVKGGLLDLSQGGGVGSNIFGGATNQWLGICAGNGGGSGADGAYLQMFGNYSAAPGAMYVVASGTPSSGTSFYYQPTGGTSVSNMLVRNDGKVIIGSDLIAPPATIPNPTPDGYLLYVSRGILTEKLKVANAEDGANWSDFVFNPDYKLKSLNEVEAFVKKNRHLPEIPSAEEVTKNGIDVAKMDALLLQKIEELTLYTIELQKQVEELKQQKH